MGLIRFSGCRFHRNHPVGMHLAILAANRDVFAGVKDVRAEAITALVVFLDGLVVVENPARMLRAARLVHQEPNLVLLPFPKAAHTAMLAVSAPERLVDMTFAVERGHEFIPVPHGAQWDLLGAGKIDPDALELVWQRCHARSLRQVAVAGPNCVTRGRAA